ncbi:MAG: DUF5320 domain-containing protein [Ignavibacteriaceae bacterium]|nr:DUF5320 domain-containing protein [Ignavibacteriaceae bacterium]
MPNFDGTGPSGQGPLTGRRRGRCRDTKTAKTEKLEIKTVENKETTYGFGRGGRSVAVVVAEVKVARMGNWKKYINKKIW